MNLENVNNIKRSAYTLEQLVKGCEELPDGSELRKAHDVAIGNILTGLEQQALSWRAEILESYPKKKVEKK